jgi:hypothetical protein
MWVQYDWLHGVIMVQDSRNLVIENFKHLIVRYLIDMYIIHA